MSSRGSTFLTPPQPGQQPQPQQQQQQQQQYQAYNPGQTQQQGRPGAPPVSVTRAEETPRVLFALAPKLFV